MIYIQTGMHDQMNVTQTITCNTTTLAPPSVWGYFWYNFLISEWSAEITDKVVRFVGKNQWVSPRDGKWAVHGEGNSKDTKIFDKKSDAVEYGKNISKNQQSEFIVQKKNGQIQSKDSFGNDPIPPRDTEH